ncbi:hypothetical protein HC928_22660 [bacterium]|nr:hypothetical protein [bacterium]
MDRNITLGILFTGEGMSPGRIRSKEIAEVIESIEEMIACMVIREHPELDKENIVIGLKSIRKGSLSLEFSTNLEELTLNVVHRIAESIKHKNYGALPRGTVISLRKLSAFMRRHQCNGELFEDIQDNGEQKALATLTPEATIPEAHLLSGNTVLYGEITRVGGVEPKIKVKPLSEGKAVYCSTSKAVAKEAALRLYTKVGLHGIARWNTETFEMESFHVTEISDYEETSPAEGFEEMKALVGDFFDRKIDDVDRFVHEMRHGSSEV